VAEVDAFDEAAIDAYIGAGRGTIGWEDRCPVQRHRRGRRSGTSRLDLAVEDFERAIVKAATTQFITGRAAARRIVKQGS
jgi:hypothetical protein